jgi:molybdate transport system ATP-binding protein
LSGPRPPLLSLKKLALRSAGRLYFADTDWDICAGEHWAILGPNGSGKSLLASALAGHLPVAQGSMTYRLGDESVAGHDLGTGYARRGQVVLLSLAQQQALAERLAGYHQARWNSSESNSGPTVAALLDHHSIFAINPFEVLPPPEDAAGFERRRKLAIEVLCLAPLLDRRVKQLSNGETRRLLIARAMGAGPRLLVLDDPFSGLDVAGRAQLHGALDELAHETTLVIATARRSDIPACVTHVLAVDGGQVTGKGEMTHGSPEPPQANAQPHSVRGADSPRAPNGLTDRGKTRSCERAEARRGKILDVSDRGATKDRDANVGFPDGSQSVRCSGTEVLVEMNDVTVRYGDAVILDKVSFCLRRGEHCALLGPNGAGKSTLLSLLLGDNPQAYANDIRLFGRQRGSGESIWDIKSRIGWVAPELLLHYPPAWSCREVVLSGFFASVGLYREGTPSQDPKVLGILAWMGLDSQANRPLHELSHGNQRMVLLARALVADPDLVVLDEPCHGLDAQHTAMVNQAVDRAARELATSTLYVTHHEGELPACVTRVLRLKNGRSVP